MFSWIRRRLTFANVAVTLALVFAMSGGAYAAGKYLINSTKQINPKVLKQLKGAKGAPGTSGAAGAVGPAGPQGPAGPTGAKGETGPAGLEGHEGKEGKEGPEGPEGSPWTAGGTLPAGKTEMGEWSFSNENKETPPGEGTKISLASISFTVPLAKALGATEVHFVTKTEWETKKGPKECPGTDQEPEAVVEPTTVAGVLCVYASYMEGVHTEPVFIGSVGFSALVGAQGAAVNGAVAVFYPEGEEGTRLGFGSWAVTAK